jgi:hypothetical protein
LAENVVEVAKPCPFVVAVLTPLANVPLAPLPGGVHVTVTPLTGLLPLSRTNATKGEANAVVILALCPEPLDTTTEFGAPGWFVRVKLAGVVTLATEAVTV